MSAPLDPKEELYKTTLLRHYRTAQYRRKQLPQEGGAVWKEESRSCGDRITLWLQFGAASPARIDNACFAGEGCSISVASADLASEALKGHGVLEASARVHKVLAFLDRLERMEPATNPLEDCPDLACLESLAKYPTRVACARLAWRAASELLANLA